ncbi:MAG: helix-turn-helix domain-containing protein [Bryobacteraceae bacterium]
MTAKRKGTGNEPIASTPPNPFNPFGMYRVWQAIKACELSPVGKLLYETLIYHAGKDGECFPKIAMLARQIRMSQRRVNHGRQTPNRYEFSLDGAPGAEGFCSG